MKEIRTRIRVKLKHRSCRQRTSVSDPSDWIQFEWIQFGWIKAGKDDPQKSEEILSIRVLYVPLEAIFYSLDFLEIFYQRT
jgi:hypothetical protein